MIGMSITNYIKTGIDGVVIVCYYITVADLGNCNAVVAERQTR
jgi:hypothetical protein